MRAVLLERLVDNPSLTDGLAYSETAPRHLKQKVTENAITRIGALCYVRRREPHHEKAAEKFKSDYEAIYGSGGGAVDPSREPVDTSIIAHDSGMASRIDRNRSVRAAIEFLGKDKADIIIACVVLSVAPGEGYGWRVRDKRIDLLLSALDELAELYHLKGRE